MSENVIIEEIKTYANRKTIILTVSLLISGGGILIACILSLLEGIGVLKINIAMFFYVLYILAMLTSILVINHYEKVRKGLIRKFETSSLKYFFEYFSDNPSINFAYYEIKDIFMYGLWKLQDENVFVKLASMLDLSQIDEETIFDNIQKKQIMSASIFRCLTFEKEGITYRNQRIYLDSKLFSDIIKAYQTVYSNKSNHKHEYIERCREIEEKFKKYKTEAREKFQGLPKKQTFLGQWYAFVSKSDNVCILKTLLFITALVFLGAQVLAHCTEWQYLKEHMSNIDFIVTLIYEAITIVLLWVDILIANKDKSIY